MTNLKKLFAAAMATAMLATMSTGAFAASAKDPAGLQEFGDKYGITVEYVGEREGAPVYEIEDLEKFNEIIANQKLSGRASCQHDWFYIWTTKDQQCIRNSRNHHTYAQKLEKCNKCGVIMNTGEWEIWDCPSGCRKSDYL